MEDKDGRLDGGENSSFKRGRRGGEESGYVGLQCNEEYEKKREKKKKKKKELGWSKKYDLRIFSAFACELCANLE
jgi:hypothetical protein